MVGVRFARLLRLCLCLWKRVDLFPSVGICYSLGPILLVRSGHCRELTDVGAWSLSIQFLLVQTQGRAIFVFPELTELSWHGVAIEYVPGYATEFAYFCTSSSISTGTARCCGSLPLARGHRYRLN